jgi:hypothetical protein
MILTLQLKDTDWLTELKKQDPTIYCLQKTHITGKDTYRLKMKGWKTKYQENGNKQTKKPKQE